MTWKCASKIGTQGSVALSPKQMRDLVTRMTSFMHITPPDAASTRARRDPADGDRRAHRLVPVRPAAARPAADLRLHRDRHLDRRHARRAPPARDPARRRRRHRPGGRRRDHPRHRRRCPAAGADRHPRDVGRRAAQRLGARHLGGRRLGDAAGDDRPGRERRFSPNRYPRGAIGGAVALAITLLFPPGPLPVGRAAQAVFGRLGRALERTASALGGATPAAPSRPSTRRAPSTACCVARRRADHQPRDRPHHATRFADREPIDRYARARAVDLAVRNTRVLARHALRACARARAPVERREPSTTSPWLRVGASRRLRPAGPRRGGPRAGLRGRRNATARRPAGDALAEVAEPVRSTAVDLMRAAELVAGKPDELDRGDPADAGSGGGDPLGAHVQRTEEKASW